MQTNFNLIESLKFFDFGQESSMFRIKKKQNDFESEKEDLIITMRKYETSQNGREVIMVIVRDVTE